MADFVIARKRRRRHAIDPYLGYYVSSDTAAPETTAIDTVDYSGKLSTPLVSRTTAHQPTSASITFPAPALETAVAPAPAPASIPAHARALASVPAARPDNSLIPHIVTVEEFLRDAVATPARKYRTRNLRTRRSRVDTRSPSPLAPISISKYPPRKRRNVVLTSSPDRENAPSPHPKTKQRRKTFSERIYEAGVAANGDPEDSLVVKDPASTRKPLRFVSERPVEDDEEPRPSKLRRTVTLVDPRRASRIDEARFAQTINPSRAGDPKQSCHSDEAHAENPAARVPRRISKRPMRQWVSVGKQEDMTRTSKKGKASCDSEGKPFKLKCPPLSFVPLSEAGDARRRERQSVDTSKPEPEPERPNEPDSFTRMPLTFESSGIRKAGANAPAAKPSSHRRYPPAVSTANRLANLPALNASDGGVQVVQSRLLKPLPSFYQDFMANISAVKDLESKKYQPD